MVPAANMNPKKRTTKRINKFPFQSLCRNTPYSNSLDLEAGLPVQRIFLQQHLRRSPASGEPNMLWLKLFCCTAGVSPSYRITHRSNTKGKCDRFQALAHVLGGEPDPL